MRYTLRSVIWYSVPLIVLAFDWTYLYYRYGYHRRYCEHTAKHPDLRLP